MWCCVLALSLPGEHQGARTKSACAWNYSNQWQNISDQVYLPICLGCNQLLSTQSVLFHTSQIWRWGASDSGSNSHHFYTASLQKHLKVSVNEDTKQLQCSMKQNVLTLLYPPASSRDPPSSSTKSQANLNPPTSLPQAFLSSFISFCQVLHLKSVSQKGRAAKLRYRALRQLTELCWRQVEENTWHMPQDKNFSLYTLFIHNHLCMLRFGEALASSFLKSPWSMTALQECLLFSGLVYKRAREAVSIT